MSVLGQSMWPMKGVGGEIDKWGVINFLHFNRSEKYCYLFLEEAIEWMQ